jgi:hypothetical protein
VLFHKRVCSPLADSLFVRRPHTTQPASKIEAADHKPISPFSGSATCSPHETSEGEILGEKAQESIADPAASDLRDELSAEGSGCEQPCPNHEQRAGFRCRRRRDVRRVQDARRRTLRGHDGVLRVVAWRSVGRREIRDGGDLSTTGVGGKVNRLDYSIFRLIEHRLGRLDRRSLTLR